jgi:pimeloyl-ACP methyl ester carboxylesterase
MCAVLPLLLILTGWLLGFALVRRVLGRKTMEHGERVPAGDLRYAFEAMLKAEVLPQLLDTMGRDGPVAPFRPQVPVTIVWSERDRVIPFERYSQSYLRNIEGARSMILAGAGHVPMYDDPERVSALILEHSAAPSAH